MASWSRPTPSIFRNNCYKSCVQKVTLSFAEVDAQSAPGLVISVDLASQTVSAGCKHFHFDIEPLRKECQFEGVADIDLSLRYKDQIAGSAKTRLASQLWLALEMRR
jgi:3-isopropylmalate/(R)-2-methylmalate dehydratase small subunit